MRNQNLLVQQSQQSFVNIEYDSLWSSSIVGRPFFKQDDSVLCLYFPQLIEILYTPLAEQEKDTSLYKFATAVIASHVQLLKQSVSIEPNDFVLKEFGERELTIFPNAVLRHRRRVQVVFNSLITERRQAKARLSIRYGQKMERIKAIPYDFHKKMQIRDIMALLDLEQLRFTSLWIRGSIIRGYETLEEAKLKEGEYEGSPLLTIQSFYHQMRTLYSSLKRTIDFDGLIEQQTDNNPELKRYLQRIYKECKSKMIDAATQKSIIYLTSSFYKPSKQKELIYSYLRGSIKGTDNSALHHLCLMIHKIQSINNIGTTFPLYFAEEVDQNLIRRGQIIRVEAFCPAFTSIEHFLKANQGKMAKLYTIFEVDHLTAQYVGLFNNEINTYSHIVLPFTEYYVEEARSKEGYQIVKIHEMPFPKQLVSSLVIWIDENLHEARLFDDNHLKKEDLGIELLLFKTNKVYQFWLKHYLSMTVNRKVNVITSISKTQKPTTILQSIFLTRKYLGEDTRLMLYVDSEEECRMMLQEGECPLIDRLLITQSHKILESFIKSVSPYSTQTVSTCQTQNCTAY